MTFAKHLNTADPLDVRGAKDLLIGALAKNSYSIFGWRELDTGMKIKMNNFYFSYLVRRHSISILIMRK